MPTGRQIRAGRGLLEWSADDLAEKSGITRQTITLIEGGKQPQDKTLHTLLGTFDKYGIEFTEGEGVRFREKEVHYFGGKEGYRQMLDHICKVMSANKGGRVRQIASDAKYLAYAGDYEKVFVEKMAEIPGLDSRTLTVEGDTYFPASYCKYRWLPKQFGTMAPFCVYGDYVVLPVKETNKQMELVSVHSKLLADRYADQFEAFWAISSEPKMKKDKAKH